MTGCGFNDFLILHDTACGRTLDDHVEMISDLLPQGRAWPRNHDSTLMSYWRAFADVIKYADDRLCALADEFFCSTANETLEVWAEMYLGYVPAPPDVDAACLNPGADLNLDIQSLVCAKVAAQGGSECAYFTSYAEALGWVITCDDISDTPIAQVGCWELGIALLAESPKRVVSSGQIGRAPLDGRYSGPASGYPMPQFFDAESEKQRAPGGGIGSPLGLTPLSSECCNFAGYYEYPPCGGGPAAGYCSGQAVGAQSSFMPSADPAPYPVCDNSGDFEFPNGFAHHWRVTVDVPASATLQASRSALANLFPSAGCLHAGDFCSPLCQPVVQDLWDALDEVKPAHTTIIRELVMA